MKHRIARWLARDDTIATSSQRATHTYVIGQPGVGKTRALEYWAMQDILAGRGVGIIDPHGDMFKRLVARLASRPALWERVIVVDPTDGDWVVSVDPLRTIGSFSQQRLALFLTDIIVKIWGVNPAQAPRMVWLLTNSFLALADLDLTLLDLPRFLMDRAFRESLLPRVMREEVLTYFYYEYPRSDGAVRQWATPVLNKIGGLIFDPDLRLMLAGSRPIDFRAVLDTRRILLVNLSKGILGEGSSALLGAFIVAQIQKAALSRSDTHFRPPYFLYLDEFQNYTTDNIRDVLSESRKYTLSLTLAHQYLSQLEPALCEAVLNTSGTLVSFRVGYQDAFRLAKEIFPSPGSLTRMQTRPRQRWFGTLPVFTVETRHRPLGWDGMARTLANLPYRQFWARRRGSGRPLRQRTIDIPDPALEQDAIVALRDTSGARYGHRKDDVRQELAGERSWSFAGGTYSHPATGVHSPKRMGDQRDTPPLWSP